jgi:hypothetical protein
MAMKEYALVENGQFREVRRYEKKPPDIPHKGIVWAEVRRLEGPVAGAALITEDHMGEMVRFYDITRLSDEFIPPEVPESITRRQCALELHKRGMISAAEALAMTKDGTPPAAVMEVFNALPEESRVMALIDFAATAYYRANQLIPEFMTAKGMSAADVDQFFIAAAKL